mmetsp:Transcript_56719/g.139188  ORF Transcript_56719/g.139188 Transcript_56719/m.139188 type:complete len:275 (+) Transcript_56719:200-1024(+)
MIDIEMVEAHEDGEHSKLLSSHPGISELRECAERPHVSDRYLMRFLNANNQDVVKAKKQLQAYTELWQLNKWDRVTYSMVREEFLRKQFVLPPDLVDKQGRHTIIWYHGLYCPKEGSSAQKNLKLFAHLTDWLTMVKPSAPAAGLNILIDFSGFGMANWDLGLIGHINTSSRQAEAIPFKQVRILHVNMTPAFVSAWDAIQKILSEETKKKMLFFKNGRGLLSEYHAHMLPESLGGTYKIDVQKLDALLLTSEHKKNPELRSRPRVINFRSSQG